MSPKSSSRSEHPSGAPTFSALPHAVLFDERLSRDARLLYAVMQAFWWQGGECWASNATLAGKMGCSESQLRRYICELLDAAVITARRRGQGQGKAYAPTEIATDGEAQPLISERFNRSSVSGSVGANRSPVTPQPLTGGDSNRSPVTDLRRRNEKEAAQQEEDAAADFFDVTKRSITEHPRWDDIGDYVSAWADLNTPEGAWPAGFWTPEVVRLMESAIDSFDADTMWRAAEWGHRLGGKPLRAVVTTARRMASDPPTGRGERSEMNADPNARQPGEDFMVWLRRQDTAPPGAMSTGWRAS
jgi:hypothetical protein